MVNLRPMIVNYSILKISELYWHFFLYLKTFLKPLLALKDKKAVTLKMIFSEYASVGYMAKRIQMRKNRFLALQKMAEQKKNEAMNATNAAMNDNGPPDHHGIPKQTVSF